MFYVWWMNLVIKDLIMAIIVNLDVMMAKRKVRLKDLSKRVGINQVNLSLLKTGKARGVRFETLNSICRELECKPGDILDYDEKEIRK